MLRTGAKPEHTRQYLATQQRRHYRYPAAYSWRCPSYDCHETVRRKWIAVNPLYTVVFGMTNHQTIEQSKMTLAFGWILQFQCPDESIYLKNNTYNKYKPYNTKSFQILVMYLFCKDCYYCLKVSNKSQETHWRWTWPLDQEHIEQYDMNGVYGCRDYEINIKYCIN